MTHPASRSTAALLAVFLAFAGTAALPALAQDHSPLPRAGTQLGDLVTLQPTVAGLSLFKNGLVLVEQTITVPGPGVYVLDTEAPAPVHGTFWVKSTVPAQVGMTMREKDIPTPRGALDVQTQFAGRQVSIVFKDDKRPALSGKVVSLAHGQPQWDHQPPHQYYQLRGNYPQFPTSNFLVIEIQGGRALIDPSTIAQITVEGQASTIRVEKPAITVTVQGEAGQPASIAIRYLARGISWAPSYVLQLEDDKTLTLTQSAVIKNEWMDFSDTPVRLISGFPAVRFAHVTSPLSLETTWAQFFAQSNQNQDGMERDRFANRYMMQNVVMAPSTGGGMPGIDPASLAGDGLDIHYLAIGNVSLKEGNSMHVQTGMGQSDYQRIVKWTVTDPRDIEGRWTQQPEENRDEPWDALLFKNPLPFALTTAPATMMAGGNFLGQDMATWTTPGEETTLNINKALSVKTRATEFEEEGQRELVRMGGANYRKVRVKGELTIKNHRNIEANLVICRQFSGTLLEAQGEPEKSLRTEGVYSINPRRDLTWKFPLKGGEEKKLAYRYEVLIRE